nr:MAG TPA: hypothetical protein [Caudoviricetes sp.]
MTIVTYFRRCLLRFRLRFLSRLLWFRLSLALHVCRNTRDNLTHQATGISQQLTSDLFRVVVLTDLNITSGVQDRMAHHRTQIVIGHPLVRRIIRRIQFQMLSDVMDHLGNFDNWWNRQTATAEVQGTVQRMTRFHAGVIFLETTF